MSIVRVHKNKNFTVMSNHHFKEKKMSLKAKGLLSLMLSLPDSWNYSISGLVTLSKDGKDSVMSALSELEKFGYLARVQLTNSKGQFNGVEYNIFEEPQKDNSFAEKPKAENENGGKPTSDNPPQLNTKVIKDLENKVMYDINNYIDILESIPDDQLRNYYCYFLDNRANMNDPLTRKGLEMLIERVRELAGLNIDKQKELLKVAVINNWKNVYVNNTEDPEAAELKELKDFYS